MQDLPWCCGVKRRRSDTAPTWLTALECWSTWWLGNQACSGVQIWEIQQRGSRATRRALWRRQHDSTGIGGVGIPRFQHDPRHGPVLSHARHIRQGKGAGRAVTCATLITQRATGRADRVPLMD